MKLFDLHCDTLYRAIDEGGSIIDNNYHLSVVKGKNYDAWVQCFAIWIPDYVRGMEALKLFDCARKKLDYEIANNEGFVTHCKNAAGVENAIKNNKCAAIFTVEGGAVLAGDLRNLEYLSRCGVKMITLTWNGDCEIGGGVLSESQRGLTDFGENVVRSMNELSIAVDVSHASDNLFYDVVNVSNAPIVASHSNSRKVCCNKRNLTDEQFNIIKSRKGLVGINFSRDFLKEDGNASAYDILRHVEYFLSLGGEKIICLGSDFDGTDMPDGITGVESMQNLYDLFLRHNYHEGLVDDLFFNNAFNFFKKLG